MYPPRGHQQHGTTLALVARVSPLHSTGATLFVECIPDTTERDRACVGIRTQEGDEVYANYNLRNTEFWHGSTDATLAPKNYDETLKQWTNVFGVNTTPTSSKKDSPEKNYRTDDFGPSVEGIWAQGVGHSVPSHLSISEAWFGL